MSELENNLIHRFNAGDALRRSAARSPQQPAIRYLDRKLNYGEFDALANQAARLLLSSGICRGDSVAIFAANSPEYAAVFFACARIGAVLVPINLMFTAEEVGFVLEKTRVKALLLDPVFAAKVSRPPETRFFLDDGF